MCVCLCAFLELILEVARPLCPCAIFFCFPAPSVIINERKCATSESNRTYVSSQVAKCDFQLEGHKCWENNHTIAIARSKNIGGQRETSPIWVREGSTLSAKVQKQTHLPGESVPWAVSKGLLSTFARFNWTMVSRVWRT